MAAVVAASRYDVYDLLEAISVECEKLEAVMTIDEALKGDIMIHEGLQSNVSVDVIYRNGDVEEAFSAADKVVEDEISVHRTFPSPKETRGVVAEWKGGKLHIWASNQGPFRLRDQLAEALGPAEELILKDGWIERKNGERVFAIGELSREEEISAFEFVRGQDIFSYGVHIAVVELDRETYKLKRVQYFAIDDTGRTINPLIAESQIVGGVAQGISYVFYESVGYGDGGALNVGSIFEAGVAAAEDLP